MTLVVDPLAALIVGVGTGLAAVAIWPNPAATPWPWVLASVVAWVVGDLVGCVLVGFGVDELARGRQLSTHDRSGSG
jgi:hypothetical protein